MSKKGQVWKIAVYIRLSREDGNDESVSVSNQRNMIRDFIAASLEGEHTVAGEYVDDGATGTDYDRPAFQQMLRDIERGRVNCVVCKTLSRAFRNYADQGYFLENFFPRYAVRFISLGGPRIDSYLDPEAVNGYEIPISGIMNDRYAGRTSADVRRTFDMKRRRGEFIGSFAPYGYRKDPQNKNRLLVDEEAAQTVREIFRLFLSGTSKRGIALRLNELGLPNPAAYKREKGIRYHNPGTTRNDGLWNPGTVAYILKNPTYIGTMVQGKQRVISYKVHTAVSVPEEEWFVVDGTHEPIIDRASFQLVQELCRRDTRAVPESRRVYPLSGFVFCGDCGKAMARSASKGIGYYICRTYKDKLRTACSRHSIRVERVEGIVLAAIQRQLLQLETTKNVVEAVERSADRERKDDRLQLLLQQRREALERNDMLSDALYADWRSGEITQEEYRRRQADTKKRQEQLRRALAQLTREREEGAGAASEKDPCLERFAAQRTVTVLERRLVAELIDRVRIHESGEVEVIFRFLEPGKGAAEVAIGDAGG